MNRLFAILMVLLSLSTRSISQTDLSGAEAGIEEESSTKPFLPPPPPGPPHIRRFFEVLRERDPEEYSRLLRLRDEDPAAFRAELAELVEERREKKRHGSRREGPRERPERPGRPPPPPHPGEWRGPHGFELRSPELEAAEHRVHELALSARKADSAEERDRLVAELKKELARVFDLRDELRREHIRQAREQLDWMEKRLDERRARKDAIIQRRMTELLDKDNPER